MLRRYVSLLLLLVVAAACGGDDGTGAQATTAGAGPSTTRATSATTAAPPVESTSTTPPPPTPQPSAQGAVDALLGAWRAGDRALALAVAEPAAVDALFAVAPEQGEARGCNEPPPGVGANTYCVYRLNAGQLQVRAAERPGGFVVDQVVLSPA